MKNKACPFCTTEFKKARRVFVSNTWGNLCPGCGEQLFYKKNGNGIVDVIPLRDKIAVDFVIGLFNSHIGLEDLGEATHRERAYAYRMLSWMKERLSSSSQDIGMSYQEFFEGFWEYILSLDHWSGLFKTHREPSLMLVNGKKNRLARNFYKLKLKEREVYEHEEKRLIRVMDRLRSSINQIGA